MHEQGCKCSECCYPQRQRPAASQVGSVTEMSKEALKTLREKQLDKNWPYVGN